jgi:predicted PurR-regulated permease PerM
MDRLRALVHGCLLLLIVGWVLYIGQAIFIPAVFGAVIVYIVVGLAHAAGRLPVVGQRLPLQLRYLFSIAVIGLVFFLFAYLVMAHKERAIALAPQYQQSLLAAIQRAAAYFGFETEPSWTTLRQDLMAQISLQPLIGSALASLGSIVATFVVVLLYATFLLVERSHFETKLANLSDDPARVARIREVIEAVNRRIGSYLALKTLLSLLLGVVSYGVMRLYGLEFAALWAVLAGFLNFIPYVGSVLGVVLPVLMAVVQFGDLGLILTLLLALTFVQFVIGNFLDPYVMGNSLNLSPFAILVSLALWSELWGVPGAFLAVPITAIATIVFSTFPGTRPIAVLLSKSGRL